MTSGGYRGDHREIGNEGEGAKEAGCKIGDLWSVLVHSQEEHSQLLDLFQ